MLARRLRVAAILAVVSGLESRAEASREPESSRTPREWVTLGIARKSESPPNTDAAREAFLAATKGADEIAAGEAFYLLGDLDETEGDYPRAMTEYERSRDLAPGNRYAPNATTHLAALRNHSEGGFAPLRALDRVRKQVGTDTDLSLTSQLARDLESFPVGRVKAEARMLVAETYLRHPERRAEAENQLRALVREPSPDPVLPRIAAKRLVDELLLAGDLREARAAALSEAALLDAKFVEKTGELARRPALVLTAEGLVGAALFLPLSSLAMRRDELKRLLRGIVPHLLPILLFGALVGIVGGALASNFETGTGGPFYAFALASTPLLLLLRVWGAVGSGKALPRALRFALGVTSILGVAFLVLERTNPMFLESFHL